MVLRLTKNFKAEQTPSGVLVSAFGESEPKSRVVSFDDWETYLKGMSDMTFDAACVFDYGIGVFSSC